MAEELMYIVSDLFIEIYLNFNITQQTDKMDMLSRKELLLLLILCIDKHNQEDVVVDINLSKYQPELKVISQSLPQNLFDIIDVTDSDLISLGNSTGNEYIDVDNIIDKYNNPLPDRLSDSEALLKRREININCIVG